MNRRCLVGCLVGCGLGLGGCDFNRLTGETDGPPPRASEFGANITVWRTDPVGTREVAVHGCMEAGADADGGAAGGADAGGDEPGQEHIGLHYDQERIGSTVYYRFYLAASEDDPYPDPDDPDTHPVATYTAEGLLLHSGDAHEIALDGAGDLRWNIVLWETPSCNLGGPPREPTLEADTE